MPKFNGQAFLKDNGLELVGTTEKPGVIRVRDSYGQEDELSIPDTVGKLPEGTEYNYNDPSTALQTSPVSFTDRLKLSLGNAKGQVQYLKKNYQDSMLDADGNLLVKDKGAWHSVDARGLGDGSGWDIAKELAGDVADLAGDAVSAVGQAAGGLLGAAVGGAGGAASGAAAGAPAAGVGAIPGAAAGLGAGAALGGVAGSAAGGGLARGATIALGRVLGTYDATPEEMAKDVALDMALSAGGEAIALGAKTAIYPAMKRAISNLAESASGPTKSLMASFLSLTSGARPDEVVRAFDRPVQVNGMMDKIIRTAGADTTDGGLAAAARKNATSAVADLVEDAQGALSSQWRKKQAEIIANAPADLAPDLQTPLRNGINAVGELGLLDAVTDANGNFVRYAPLNAQQMSKKLAAQGVDEISAQPLARSLSAWTNAANTVLQQTKPLEGPAAVKQALDIQRAFDDFYYNLVDGRPQLENILTPISSHMRNEIQTSLGSQVNREVAGLNSFYSKNKPYVQMVQRAASGPEQLEGFVGGLFTKDESNIARKDALKAIAQLKGKAGEGLHDLVQDAVTAHSFIGFAPKGALGASVPRLGAAVAAGSVLGPVAGAATAALSSPRILAQKVIPTAARVTGALGTAFKSMDSVSRRAMLNNPELVGAALTEAARSFQGP